MYQSLEDPAKPEKEVSCEPSEASEDFFMDYMIMLFLAVLTYGLCLIMTQVVLGPFLAEFRLFNTLLAEHGDRVLLSVDRLENVAKAITTMYN